LQHCWASSYLQAHVTGNTGSAVTNVFIPSLDVMDAAERYARLLRGEDVGAPALPSRVIEHEPFEVESSNTKTVDVTPSERPGDWLTANALE
jgi:hypothetical protein